MTGFLHWLLMASLQACLIVPWVWLLVAFSKRMPATWLAKLLAMGMVLPLLTPWVDRLLPGVEVVMPWLEKTGLYEDKQPLRVARQGSEPLLPLDNNEARERVQMRGWTILFWSWACGALFFITGRCWLMMRERLRYGHGFPVSANEALWQLWRAVTIQAGLQRVPWLMRHQNLTSPLTLGVLNPVVIVPHTFDQWSDAQRAMILLHEAEHIARRDVRRRLALELLWAVFWFHPMFPFALKRYDLEVEMACDDAVLRAGYPSQDYAELLLAEARASRSAGKSLRKRIKALLQRERSRGWLGSRHLGFGYMLLFAALLLPAFAVKFRPWKEKGDFHPLVDRPDVGAWWRCRTGHGNVVEDWSGHARHGRVFGATWVQDEERGNCLEFDGTDDMLALPSCPGNWVRGPFTIAMWLKPRMGSDGGGLLLRGEPNGAWSGAKVHDFSTRYIDYGERELMLAGDIRQVHQGKLMPGMWPGLNFFNIISPYAPKWINDGRWTHLAVVMSEKNGMITFHCYLNGQLVTEEQFSSNLCHNEDWPTDWWWFGRGESPPVQGNYYEGRLSDLVVLPRSLNETQIRTLMSGNMPEK